MSPPPPRVHPQDDQAPEPSPAGFFDSHSNRLSAFVVSCSLVVMFSVHVRSCELLEAGPVVPPGALAAPAPLPPPVQPVAAPASPPPTPGDDPVAPGRASSPGVVGAPAAPPPRRHPAPAPTDEGRRPAARSPASLDDDEVPRPIRKAAAGVMSPVHGNVVLDAPF